jgi:hypothetical protein
MGTPTLGIVSQTAFAQMRCSASTSQYFKEVRCMRRTAKEVAEIIDNHIQNIEGKWAWDDFTSIPIRDPQLNAIRLRCVELDESPPDERLQGLKKIVQDLKR